MLRFDFYLAAPLLMKRKNSSLNGWASHVTHGPAMLNTKPHPLLIYHELPVKYSLVSYYSFIW